MSLGELVVSIVGDMSKLSSTFNDVQTGLGSVGSKISEVGSSMSSAGSSMTAGITVPMAAVTAGIGVTVNAATDFDTGMRRVATMLPGITDSAFNDISNQALDLSTQFGSSTTEMTDAMYQALSSGIPSDNVFTFMQTAEQLAIGGATDVVTSTDVLTTAVNSYGEANLSASEASDILFQGTKFGKSTVEELASTLANVVPIAASLGIGFDDVNASLATMTIQGTPTAQATTQLRAMMDELSDKNSDVAASFKYFTGQSFPEFIAAGGTMGGAVQILSSHLGELVPDMAKVASAEKQLNKPTSEMAKEFEKVSGKSFADFQKGGGTVTQALDMMGVSYGTTANKVSDYFARIEAGTGAIQLSTDSGNLYNQSLKGTQSAYGATDEAYKTMSDGMGAAGDKIKASFEVLMIKIGQELMPIISDTFVPLITDTLIPGLEKVVPIIGVIAGLFGALPGPIQIAIVGFLAFVAALGPILIVAGAIASGIGGIAALFGAGGALSVAFAFAQTAIAGIVAALGTIALPVTLIIAAVALLALAWKNNWFDIQGKFEAAKNSITLAATNLYNTLHLTWNGLIMAAGNLKTNLKTIWDVISASFTTSKTLIINTVTGLYNGLVSVYNSIKTSLSGLYTSIVTSWNNIKISISNATTAIITTLQTWYTNTQAKFTSVKTALSGLLADWTTKWNSIKAILSAAASNIVSTLQTWYGNVQTKFNNVKTACASTLASWKTHWDNFKSTLSAAASSIVSTLQTWYGNVQAKFNSVKTACSTFLNAWKTHWTNFKSALSTAASNIVSALQTLYSNIQTKFGNIKTASSTILSAWKTHWSNFVQAIKDKVSAIQSAINDVVTKIKDKVSDFKSAGKALIQGLIDGIEDKIQGIKNAMNKVTMAADGYLTHSPAKEGPFQKLPTFDAVLYDPLMDTINKTKSGVLPRLNDVLGNISDPLSNIRSPLDASVSSGLSNIQNTSNAYTSAATSYGDTTINVGPVSLSNNVDIDTLVAKINQISADQRRAKGVFL